MRVRSDPRRGRIRAIPARRSKATPAKLRRGVAAWLTGAVLVLLGLGLLWKGFAPGHTAVEAHEQSAAVAGLARPVEASGQCAPNVRTESIKQIRVGRRVWTDLPEHARAAALGEDPERLWWDFEEVDPGTWRRVELRVDKPDGHRLDVVLLRPVAWVEQSGAAPGGTIDLVLPDQGIDGPAEVLSVGPCPPTEEGPGRVVTATFTHVRGGILDVYVEGLDEPLGVTDGHHVWSVDRQEFIPAGALEVGDRLRHLGGTARVTRIVPRRSFERVYNLEVHGEHVYRVCENGLLVHNASLRDQAIERLREYLAGDQDSPVARLREIDPKARIGLRGSTATGRVGNPNKPTFGQQWNPNDFDLDLFIRSERLFGQFGDTTIPAPGVRNTLVRLFPEVFSGLRPGGSGASIRILPPEFPVGEAIIFEF